MNPNRASTTATLEGWLRLLQPRGLEPVVVTNQSGTFYEWVRAHGIPAHSVPLPRPDKRWPFPFLRCMWRLRRLVKRYRCQLVHCNEHDLYPVAGYLARLCRLPAVVGVRFTMDREFCQYAFSRRPPNRMLFVARGSLEACRPAVAGIVPESAWRVIYNGTDLDEFCTDPAAGEQFRRAHGLTAGLLLGAASALRPVKQLEHLFEAAARLKDRGARVVVAGGPVPGYEDYAAQLIARGRQLLGDRLIHLGHLADIRGFLSAIDLFVSTSQAEGCSNSVLQSLACSVPVIGYPSVSVDEQVLPGGGAIVAQDRIDLLAAELDGWLGDANRRARGKQGARDRAAQLFDVRRIADQLWEEYQTLTAAPAPARALADHPA
jgi:glycosyltransferase involved in cell wall biosynthesis